jgi:TetR/AcrR family transcriptional regulator
MFLDQIIRITKSGKMENTEIDSQPKKTRIQLRREKLVLDCALEVFATYGFHGATIDQIAAKADLSKPNVLYYFKGKEDIYTTLLQRTAERWMDAFYAISLNGDPMTILETYVNAKMDLSFDFPLPSRLFAMEVMGGAQNVKDVLQTTIRTVLDEKAAIIQTWMDQGKLKQVDPHHLIFSIWSVTQHYADFAVQIELLLDKPPNRQLAKEAVRNILLRGLKVG